MLTSTRLLVKLLLELLLPKKYFNKFYLYSFCYENKENYEEKKRD